MTTPDLSTPRGEIWVDRDSHPLGEVAGSIALAALGMTAMVFGHEQRVRQSRAIITHTHTDKPLTKRQKRRQRGKAKP